MMLALERERESQTDGQKDRRRDSRGVTQKRSSHQDEFSTVHALSEGARQLPPARHGHVQKQSAYLTHLQLSGH